jgi:hypothetical protein
MGDGPTVRTTVIVFFVLYVHGSTDFFPNSLITDAMNEVTLKDDGPAQFTASVSPSSPGSGAPLSTPDSPRPSRQIALDLPPPDSDQWETMEMPPTPPSRRANKQRKK